MYKVVYFNELNLVIDKDFETLAEATAFATGLDWYRIVTVTASRTIVDVTTP